jgi:hypothetical protein
MKNEVSVKRRLATALAGVCCAASLVAAAPAAADSLVFVKDGNVWLSNPDGSGQYQVTFDGTPGNPYVSPSQADDGTLVAGRAQPNGGPLYRLRQNGELINTIPVGAMLAGPFAPQVSPDGQLVAFEHVFSRSVNGYIETSSDVRFTRADGSTPNGFGEAGRGAGAPSWIDSGRAFVGINTIATTVVPGQASVEWWSDYDHQPTWFSFGQSVEDGEVAANGSIAVVRGEGSTGTIQLYRSSGGFTTLPTPTCTLSEPSPGPAGQEFVDPTFSPSGAALAWQEGNGIWIEDVDPGCKGNPQLLIPGASEPDWGPAPVNPGPRSVPAGPGAPAGQAPASQPQDQVRPAPKGPGKDGPGAKGLAAAIIAPKLGRALAKGLAVSLVAPGGGTVSAAAKLGAKQVASGTLAVKEAGAATVVLRFSPQARRQLASRSQIALTVAVRFTPRGGGDAVSQDLALKLKR